MSEIITDKLTGKTSAGDVTITSEGGSATMQLQQGLAKSWVNLTQISTQTVRDSLNIASITDAGNGRTYPISYTNSMNNDDYAGSFYTNAYSLDGYANFDNALTGGFGTKTTSSFGIRAYGSGGEVDSAICDVIIHGDLA